jgi:hypothetical protein
MVNKRIVVNIEGAFETRALDVLWRIHGLAVKALPQTADSGIDAVIRHGEARTPAAVEFKQHVNSATAWHLVQKAKAQPRWPLLLIAGSTTAEARRILEDHGVGVIDGLGNAHLELPGLLLHLEGKGRAGAAPTRDRRTRLAGKAGVAAQALLLDPERAWRVDDLAQVANVSVGLAHQVLARLEKEAVVVSEGAGPQRRRRLVNPTALLDLWAEEHRDRLTQHTGYLLAQTDEQLARLVGTRLAQAEVHYALTGAAGARLVAPFVTAVPVLSAWVPATLDPRELWEVTQGRPATDGHNVVFCQVNNDAGCAFRRQYGELWVVNPFRLYVDLLDDPRRGREQADNLRREVIGF